MDILFLFDQKVSYRPRSSLALLFGLFGDVVAMATRCSLHRPLVVLQTMSVTFKSLCDIHPGYSIRFGLGSV